MKSNQTKPCLKDCQQKDIKKGLAENVAYVDNESKD